MRVIWGLGAVGEGLEGLMGFWGLEGGVWKGYWGLGSGLISLESYLGSGGCRGGAGGGVWRG